LSAVECAIDNDSVTGDNVSNQVIFEVDCEALWLFSSSESLGAFLDFYFLGVDEL